MQVMPMPLDQITKPSSPVKFKTVREEPLIRLYSNMISSSEATHIKAQAMPQMHRAHVSDPYHGHVSDSRTNDVAWLDKSHDSIVQQVCERIADVVDLPFENAETMQVIRYQSQQQYKAHFDAYDKDSKTGDRCTQRGGQRLVTALLYLSDVEQGGETEFPKLKFAVKPKTGFMLMFENCYKDSDIRHPLSLHAGKPVIAGEKWACNLWFRENEFF